MKTTNKWFYLILLTFIWGSSFILMKKTLVGFNALHVGSLRILVCTTFLVLVFGKRITKIKKHHWKWVIISGIVGSLFPAYLYVYAVKGIGSSIPAILNSLTPLNTLWVSIAFFNFSFNKKQLTGVLVGLIGTVMLIYQGSLINPNQNYFYAILPLICSVGYAFNVNIIKKHLHDLDPIAITVGNFIVITIPSILILLFSDFFTVVEFNETTQTSFIYLILLAVIGTATAKILFNNLIVISSTIFASSVTYLIPIVAVIWGVLDGETISKVQILSGFIILVGVWLVNKNK